MAKGKQDRRARVPFGVQRKKLNIDAETEKRLKAQGLRPRWIKDEGAGSRLIAAEQGGYDFVMTEGVELGDAKEAQERDRRIKYMTGTNKDGSPQYSYLMAIPEEYFQEDKAKKESVNRMVDDAIRGGQTPGVENHGLKPDQGATYAKNIEYRP
jgi:hypothetical protein